MAEELHAQQRLSSLTQYPQMIMEAIDACDDDKGCSKTAITNYIDSKQLVLPPSHPTLLNYHLIQMQRTGQIVLVKINYMKPNPNAPVKRGRGRPSKSEQVNPSHVEDLSETLSIQSEKKRSRGRPRKKPITEESETVKAKEEAPMAQRRGRGRPRKVKPVMVPVEFSSLSLKVESD